MKAYSEDINEEYVAKMIEANREFLRANLWAEWKLRDMQTPQRRGEPAPPLQKPYAPDAPLIDLVPADDFTVGDMPLIEAIRQRKSRREYTDTALTLEELSFLLWSMQGVHDIIRDGVATTRTVPSGGARHPFETYLYISRVEGLTPGLYRYLPLSHQLCVVSTQPDLKDSIHVACLQPFVKHAAVIVIWAVIPYRTEWRYSFLAHKVIAQETGHICQNLYLACESIGAGACALGTYDQEALDSLLGLDGDEEFAVYVAPLGKVLQT